MYPWLMFWSPRFYFPFSGSVQQRIDPSTDWFFAGIPAQAGDGKVEQQIFDVASYGRQLGWISEILLGMNSDDSQVQAKGVKSLEKLRAIQPRIEAAKDSARSTLQADAAQALEQLRLSDPAAYQSLVQGLIQSPAALPPAVPARAAQARPISKRSKAS